MSETEQRPNESSVGWHTRAGRRLALGRKRDPARNALILNATLGVLAEQACEGITIDMVTPGPGSASAHGRYGFTTHDCPVPGEQLAGRAIVGQQCQPDGARRGFGWVAAARGLGIEVRRAQAGG